MILDVTEGLTEDYDPETYTGDVLLQNINYKLIVSAMMERKNGKDRKMSYM